MTASERKALLDTVMVRPNGTLSVLAALYDFLRTFFYLAAGRTTPGRLITWLLGSQSVQSRRMRHYTRRTKNLLKATPTTIITTKQYKYRRTSNLQLK